MAQDDIRIIKRIDSISGDAQWQKELNIVSVNDGPFQFDIREWSLNETEYRNGISFDNEEAKKLLAILKKCIEDTDKPTPSDDKLIELLAGNNISYIDKRERGGALWIEGGSELEEIMNACKELGYKFYFSEKGGRITHGKPGWYLPSKRK